MVRGEEEVRERSKLGARQGMVNTWRSKEIKIIKETRGKVITAIMKKIAQNLFV